jgi:hypothetical protein
MRANGSVGKTNVYASWRGIPYVRQHVIPANPRTAGQLSTRTVFAWLNDLYRRLGPGALEPWDTYASGRPFTSRNGFIKQNLSNLRDNTDLLTYLASPGALGGPALASFATGAGAVAGDVTATCTIGDLPTGWALDSLRAFAILDQDAHDPLAPNIAEGNNAGPSGTMITMNMGAAGFSYLVCGWATYLRDDGRIAIGPANSAIQVSHA